MTAYEKRGKRTYVSQLLRKRMEAKGYEIVVDYPLVWAYLDSENNHAGSLRFAFHVLLHFRRNHAEDGLLEHFCPGEVELRHRLSQAWKKKSHIKKKNTSRKMQKEKLFLSNSSVIVQPQSSELAGIRRKCPNNRLLINIRIHTRTGEGGELLR